MLKVSPPGFTSEPRHWYIRRRNRIEGSRSGVDELLIEMKRRLGETLSQRALSNGTISIAQSHVDLPYPVIRGLQRAAQQSARPIAARAVRYLNRCYLVADHAKPDEVLPLLTHELGVHVGLELTIGATAKATLMRDLRAAASLPDALADAWRTVADGYGHLTEGSDRFLEEVLAHTAEAGGRFRQDQLRDAAIRWRTRARGRSCVVEAADIQIMARIALQRVLTTP
jgi:hypothetical protein